ncbi:unnamed protein product, partial [marine sediment metagenome]
EKMNHNCDNCGRLGDTIQIVTLEYSRGWGFWKKYPVVLRKFCTFECLYEFVKKDKVKK